MSKNKKPKTKSSKEMIELFSNSDDDIDSLDTVREACINYTTDFDKWTVHHFYAMKKREKYPNMFFYYFPRSLFRASKMSEKDKAKIIDYIFNNNEKNINGKWGYLSLLLDSQNICGAELFTSICNNRVIINLSNSFPLKEDAKCDFDENINKKVENILESKRELYNKVLADFENYLNEQMSEAVKKKYYNFVKNHEDRYIYCDKNKNLYDLIDGLLELQDEHKKNNEDVFEEDNIIVLPIDYNDKKKNKNKAQEQVDEDIIMKDSTKCKNSINFRNTNKITKKRKPKKKYKLYKCDFDLDFYEENNTSPIIELDENNNEQDYDINIINIDESHTNKKNKNVIVDEDEDDIMSINLNDINDTNDNGNNPTDKLKNKSKKQKNPRKLKKKETSLNSKIKYSEDNNKENFKNINYSTNLSSNANLLESNPNIDNNINNTNKSHIFTPKKQIQENNNNNDNKKSGVYDFNKENVEFYENEQNLDGYISDFTKKVYYGNEINNKIMVFSDNEDELYLRKLAPKKKKKVTRIKINEPVFLREKKNIQNYNDFKIIGVETSYIDKNIEKLKRGLLNKKKKIKKQINRTKRNNIIKQLKKKYIEEDFNDKKYQGNYKKVIREMNNLERNNKKRNNNNEERPNNNNNYSKKGNYYEIASNKKFNINNNKLNNNQNLNLNEYKKERNFFNCFANREKEDINFSDTESFLSLFKNNFNHERKLHKNKIKKNRLNSLYDDSQNQNIMTFFPKTGRTTFHKDKQIMIAIRKLIDNEKYTQLFDFIENDIHLGARIPHYISNISIEIFNNSNDINYDKINSCKNSEGVFEILYNNNDIKGRRDEEDIYEVNNKIIIENKFDIGKLSSLFKAYLDKMQIALTFLLTESKFSNNGLNIMQQQKNIIQNRINFQELNIVENLMKELISNMNNTQKIKFKNYIENNWPINDNIKNELNDYLNKAKNLFDDEFNEIISHIFITYLRFFISYKPKEIKLMDVKDFCFMAYSFLHILQTFLSKQNELQEIYRKIFLSDNNDSLHMNIYFLNLNNLYEITNKYTKCLCFFLLNNLFIYSTNDFMPIILNNKQSKQRNITSPQESLILASLFKLISSIYVENNKNLKDNNDNNNIKEVMIMFNIIFSEYLNNSCEIDTNNLGSLSEILLKDLKFYLSLNSNNVLSKEKKNLSIISNLKKAFLYNCFDIDNLIDNNFAIKKIVGYKIIINLIQRYLSLLITYFICYGKEINCLKNFNEFYTKYNNAKNKECSYFDVELISKGIIDNNMKFNGYQKVKGYLVEEYLYSDIQLMNFYDRYWLVDFNDKKEFIKNIFEIMCNDKYNPRIIDKIFPKNEIQLLISYIFEFRKNSNNDDIDNRSDDIDLDDEISYIDNNNNNENNKITRFKILNKMDSILIKALYLISESINKTLISLESNNNENKIKSNLSKFLTISNLFKSNISHLNNENYTLFIIPMICTILIYTQHLLKFKENNNIKNTINKINEILNSESSGWLLKSFSISIWINIIQKISNNNINIDISKYIEMINSIIHQIVQEYHKTQEKVFSMQIYSIRVNNDIYANKEKEYFEIISEYLKNIENFAKNNPDLLIQHHSILNEIYNILNIKYYYPPKMRIEFIDIINLLIKHLNSKYNKNLNIDKMDLSGNDKISDEEIKFNEEDLQFLMGEELNDGEESFLNFLKEKIMPNLREILDKFISMDNTNVSNKKKILYPLYEENACLYGGIFGILTKFKKIEDFIEYPRNIFNQYYNKDKERANIFDSVFQSYYSNKNEIEKEYYIKLPFKLFNIYLEYYSNLISEIITHKSFAIIMKYYLGLFFIGIFINKKRKNGIMTNEEKYCYKILDMIEHNKELLLKEKNNIKNEYIHNIFISDDNKQRISIYNLLLKLSDIYEQYKEKLKKEMNYYEFNNVLIGELLANLSIEFNIEKIDSELLFELINGPKTKYAIQQINKLSNYYNYINDKSKIYNQNEINIKLHILSKYIQPYLDTKLNSKFTLYLDDFINELSGEQILSSIVTIKFLNSVLNMDKIPNKFRNSLKKVYTTFIKKSANMCNILSLQNREGQIKEVFNDSEINEIILLYNKNKSHNIFQNMIEKKKYNKFFCD